MIKGQSPEDLEEIFKYHAPNEEQVHKYNDLRENAKMFAMSVIINCPPSADRTAALRLIREAVMTANASIALNGLV